MFHSSLPRRRYFVSFVYFVATKQSKLLNLSHEVHIDMRPCTSWQFFVVFPLFIDKFIIFARLQARTCLET